MTARPVRLALLAASPMYYQTPLYQRLTADPRLDFTAIFASSGGIRPHDAGFGEPVVWDVNPLAGYRSRFLRRAASNPIGGQMLALRDPDVVGEVLRGRYDVIWMHGYHFLTHQLLALTQRLRGGKLLVREEQTLLHSRPLWKRVLKEPYLRLLFSQVSGLYIGSQNRRWFERYGLPANRLFFTPYVVDNERLQRAAAGLRPQRQALRQDFGIADNAGPVLLSLSRLIAKKQPLHLLEAFRRVRLERRCTFLVIGSGEQEGAMRQRVQAAQIPDVLFGGFLNQTEIARGYAAADIFALVSREHETWGLVVNEAMNFSLPVLVSDKVGCAADLVQAGRNGEIVPWDDVGALARQLARLVDDAALRERYGAESLAMITPWNYDLSARGIVSAVAASVGPRRWAEACSC